MSNVFLIVGCQRSGTTLLRLCLECHSRVRCFDETRSYDLLSQPCFDSDPELYYGFKIPQWTEQLQDAHLKDGRLPVEALNFYRSQKILFLVRDPRDVVASMLSLRTEGGPWLETWGLPALYSKADRCKRFSEVYESDLALIKSTSRPRTAAAALCWKYKTAALTEYLSAGFPVLPIEYEALVRKPESELQRVCGFLDIAWEDDLCRHSERPHEELTSAGYAIGNTDPRKSIHTHSVDRYRGELDAVDLDIVARITDRVKADAWLAMRSVAPTTKVGP